VPTTSGSMANGNRGDAPRSEPNSVRAHRTRHDCYARGEVLPALPSIEGRCRLPPAQELPRRALELVQGVAQRGRSGMAAS
jgi:hypothetical protein